MSDMYDAVEVALQILFGLVGILFAIAALHYRDSLCSVLLRRYRQRIIEYHELEAGTVYPAFAYPEMELALPSRIASLPPAYGWHHLDKDDMKCNKSKASQSQQDDFQSMRQEH
ncbi:hypothetical protein EK21DRAFT_106923 [Setomelanomma holmii]|uniref:Uncharacterized protein n=1 Tax=Setomelanomma holmii TaxID=210430 RepID=A0A9P4LT40_9PLEO|nr:hypothetical protein EK21DRAFT_106923 [Setomelanomma holmii]